MAASKNWRSETTAELSSSSGSSISVSSDEDSDIGDLEENFGSLQPYRFEPYLSESEGEIDEGHLENSSEPNEGQPAALGRANNNDWCQCSNCPPMDDEVQSICCKEIHRLTEKLAGHKCITEHEGFEAVCLNRHALQTAYFSYRQIYGHHDNTYTHERYRYTGYRQFVRWNWGYLGKNVRVPLPACVVTKIRDNFPAAAYAGFEYPSLDDE